MNQQLTHANQQIHTQLNDFSKAVATSFDDLHNKVFTIAHQQTATIPPLKTLATRCQEMSGAICQNRSMILEAREDIGSLNLHMTRAEKNVQECMEYLLKPNEGLDAKLHTFESTQNQNIAVFQAEVQKTQDKLQNQITALVDIA